MRRLIGVAAVALCLAPSLAFAAGSAPVHLVQGSADVGSANGLYINPANLIFAPGAATGSQPGSLVLCPVTTAAPSYTTAQINYCSLTTAGALRSDIYSFGGAAVVTGTGASGAGIPRVTISSDSTINPQTAASWGLGTTGAAVPGAASYTGADSSGNLTGLIQADNSVSISIATAATTQLVALVAGKKIYVTSWDVIAGGTGNIQLEYGTGTNCGTGTTALTGNYNLTAQNGLSKGMGLGPVLVVPAGDALCALTSAAVQISGSLSYTQF
jgi:hypothetical protein